MTPIPRPVVAILEATRAAHAAGLCVIPPAEDGTKRPGCGAWVRYQGTRPTQDEMHAWFVKAPRAGLGLVCGHVSGDLECLEFDDRAVYDESKEVAQQAGLGGLVTRIEQGYCEDTPNGGVHWLYHCVDVGGNTKLAQRPTTADERQVLIETRGEGGFIIVAPSGGPVHPSGRPYRLRSGGFASIATIEATDRRALFALARSFDEMPRQDTAQPVHRSAKGGRPGDEYNRRTAWGAVLEPHDWRQVYSRGDTTHWRRPGKSDPGISATTNHAGSDRLYVFSSSTAFEPERSYDKFAAYAVLQHGGDFSAAARALAAQGFGEQRTRDQRPQSSDAVERPDATKKRMSRDGERAESPMLRTITLTAASSITVRPVRWLEEDRLALGTLGLLGGREGVGKTIYAYTLTASITRGTLSGIYEGTPRAVIVAATEDSWAHTIVPRLMAAGADLDLVYRVDVTTPEGTDTTLSLPCDLAALERVVGDVHAALILLDPLLSRLDTALDTHKDAEVRLALEPLVRLAEAVDVYVLGIIHVNKGTSTDPLTLLMGSRAFAAVARSVLFVLTDPEDETVRLLGQPKNNLGRDDLPTRSFGIVGEKVADTDEGPVWTGKLEWLGETDRSITEAVDAAASSSGDRTATREAAEWLADYLSDEGTACPSAAIKLEGKKAGHSADALKRARQRLRITCESLGFPRRTYWQLPQSEHARARGDPAPTAQTAPTAPTESGGRQREREYSSPNEYTVGAVSAVGAVG